jgi:hypothetical protein
VVPRSRIGSYQTLTSLQSPAGETSTTVTSFSTWPRPPSMIDQLAWVTWITRSVSTWLTKATWPRFMRAVGLKQRTAPDLGTKPVSYLPIACDHQVRASPKIWMPDIRRANGTHCQ